MKKSRRSFTGYIHHSLFILVSLLLLTACGGGTSDDSAAAESAEEVSTFEKIIWNVKAIHPQGKTLDIKAFDKDGNPHDIKAIQNSDQDSFMDVKAIVNGKELPVKMLVSPDQYAPVQAIDQGGVTYDIKAITDEGEKLDVKGVLRVGYIVIMKAITEQGDFYAVKAISPTGILNDIKGIKVNLQDREMSLHGIGIHAHVKAMHPAINEEDFKIPGKSRIKSPYKNDFERVIWNIKAVTPEGKNLDVKAFDAEGNQFDVKATQDSEQHSFMSIRTFVEGYELPVRIMDSSSEYSPVRAIGNDGTIFDVKAVTEEGVKLDVSGVNRSGNMVHVKAITESGDFYGVKAFAPDGKLNDVKGIKIFDRKIELKSQGHPVYAHLRAISQ